MAGDLRVLSWNVYHGRDRPPDPALFTVRSRLFKGTEMDASYDGPFLSAYMSSKAAVVRLTDALAAELRGTGVAVFAISPGMVKTAMTEPVFAELWDNPEVWTPPERTADLVAFIASGALDPLSGRYIHAVTDDWESMPERVEEIRAADLNALRLTR